jgi:hypothetical protein
MAIGKGLNAFLAAYQKQRELGLKEEYYALQLMYLQKKLGNGDDNVNTIFSKGKTGPVPGPRAGDEPLREGRSIGKPAPVGGFDNAVSRTMGFEGGLGRDNNGAAVNYGINAAANPDVDVANLTPEGAKAIYKSKYWDAIGGDELDKTNPALAHVAFDTAVNAGPDRARQFLAQSGGDPYKFLQLRQAHQDMLTDSGNPKYGGSIPDAWESRNNSLRADIDAYNTRRQSTAALPLEEGRSVATPALTAAPVPPPRDDNLGRALPVEAGVSAPTPQAYVPDQGAIPVAYSGYDPDYTEMVYAARGGLVPDTRKQWARSGARGALPVQRFADGGGVIDPYGDLYVPSAVSSAGYAPPPPDLWSQGIINSPLAPVSPSPYGTLDPPAAGPQQVQPITSREFAPYVTANSYSATPYGALNVPPPTSVGGYDGPPAMQPEGVPLPPRRPVAAVPRAAVPLPPGRPEEFQATSGDETPAASAAPASVADSYQLSPDHPVAQLLNGFEHAVSGGIKWLTDTLGLTNSAVQTGGGVRALASGQHALTDEEHDAVLKSVDPDGKLTPGIRNLMGMNAVYEYYLTHGSKEKAQEMAAGMLEYSKQYLQKAGVDALNAPSPQAAGKILAQGINQVPGAPQAEVDDNGNFVLKDPVSGKVVNGGRMNPQQLLAIATGAKNGTLFWQSLSKYAHSDDKADEKQTAQQKNLQDAADRRERFDKVMGFVPPDADKPVPEAIPVGGAGTPATAGETEETKDNEGDDDASTEGRSASATQAVPTTPTAAIPKGVNKPAAQSAYVNMSPILDDEIAKNPEARKVWNEMSNSERQDARMVHNARVTRALEQAKIEQAKNAPDAPPKEAAMNQTALSKDVKEEWETHQQGLIDAKKLEKPLPIGTQETIKSLARSIAKSDPDKRSGADGIEAATRVFESPITGPVPVKKDNDGNIIRDKDGNPQVDYKAAEGVLPYKVQSDRNGKYIEFEDGYRARVKGEGLAALRRLQGDMLAAKAAKENPVPGKSYYGPGWQKFDEATTPMVRRAIKGVADTAAGALTIGP